LRVLLSSQGMSFRDVQDAATGELSVAAFWANVVQYGRQPSALTDVPYDEKARLFHGVCERSGDSAYLKDRTWVDNYCGGGVDGGDDGNGANSLFGGDLDDAAGAGASEADEVCTCSPSSSSRDPACPVHGKGVVNALPGAEALQPPRFEAEAKTEAEAAPPPPASAMPPAQPSEEEEGAVDAAVDEAAVDEAAVDAATAEAETEAETEVAVEESGDATLVASPDSIAAAVSAHESDISHLRRGSILCLTFPTGPATDPYSEGQSMCVKVDAVDQGDPTTRRWVTEVSFDEQTNEWQYFRKIDKPRKGSYRMVGPGYGFQVLATKETAVKVPGKVGYEKKKKKKTRKGAPAGGAARAAGKKRRIPNRKVNCPFCGDLFHYFGLPRHKGSCKARVVEV
jgi:hypothetical protein